MINYLNLPNKMENFLKKFNYINLTKDISNHNWKYIPVDFALTNKGKQWFVDKKIPLRKYASVFKIPKNFEGPIHTDMHQSEKTDCAFNFVLSGHGEMQWVKNLKATEYTFNFNGADYNRYKDIESFDISDVWTGNVGLVRINVPHRVVTTDTDRYCLSIRLEKDSSLNTFDELSKLFGV
jgi:hypothetical protein